MAVGFDYTIEGDKALLKRVARLSDQILPALGEALRNVAQALLSDAQTKVPQKSGHLSGSAFVDGPLVNPAKNSATATCGYEAHYAAAEHEGFHGGVKTDGEPPRWLEKAATTAGPVLQSAIESAIKSKL
jgi:hypothetical protein